MKFSLSRRLASEFLGTAFLGAAILGSGIMGERLAGGNVALALVANTMATAAALVALILTFRPISGAHLNPIVSMTEAFLGGITRGEACFYILAQVSGGVLGAACANLMFALPMFSPSHHMRTGTPLWFSEFVATFGLILIIQGCSRLEPRWLPVAVACYSAAAYWFTASTSFANPAVTIARSLSDTFAGIRPADVLPFVAAQVCGGFSAILVFEWLSPRSSDTRHKP
jgi:glycerol uptake facilitator-like aquaporin